MTEAQSKVALLAGATGLVGATLLDILLDSDDFSRVVAVTRRPLAREHPRLANRTVQFDKITSQFAGFTCHSVFCCLGTTIRAAGSEEEFRKVDVDYVLALARVAQAAQAQRFIVLSSVGADAHSKNFYLRTKGEMEEALVKMNLTALDILQPSVLLGWRGELRPLELAATVLMPLVNPLLVGTYAIYRGIPVRTLALAMLGASRSARRGVSRYSYAGILALTNKRTARVAL
ncbi:MAG TPA: NAD(P)H-binding protein [Steroidobacteraceae bacterium]